VSSAILYLAIIAIWACVLVPRWIHKPHRALPEPEDLPAVQYASPPGHPGSLASSTAGDAWDQGADHTVLLPSAGEQGVTWHRFTQRRYHAEYQTAQEPSAPPEYPEQPDHPRYRAQAHPALDRAHILQARRRLLTMLVTLTIAALVGTAAKLTPWWTLVPTGGTLGMYLLLLREAAHADAEQEQWLAQERAHAEAARLRARRAWEASLPEPTAEIIDISARVTDQLYDQYADAAVRAVGD
jgi:nucleotide-binding universal stress UspA family protein